MAEIIEFKRKETVFILNFTSPSPLRMNKTGKESIAVEIRKVDEHHGLHKAWVPTHDKKEAQDKLGAMIEILDWLD